jgi:ElaB/YqjD/DUF883 family membrane-anchored ribosome-binding protein
MGKVPDDLKALPAMDAEIGVLRDRTQQLVAELERRLRARAAGVKHTIARVRRVTDVKAQLRENPALAIGLSAVVAIALGAGVYVLVSRQLAARRPLNRLKGRVLAYRALLAHPHRALHPREPIGKQVIAAVLLAGATTIVRGLSALLVKRAIEPRMLPGKPGPAALPA